MTKPNYKLVEPSYPSDSEYEVKGPDFIKKYLIPTDRPVRILCDGVYDMFHYGHARSLMQAKNLFPNVYLIVGVTSDKDTLANKGKLVMNSKERCESIRHCRYADEVIVDSPWIFTKEYIDSLNVDYVTHDDTPLASPGINDVYTEIKAANMFIPTKRTISISTTGLITRIIKDYDCYLKRQILRGISWKDLNISMYTENKVRIKQSICNKTQAAQAALIYSLNKIRCFTQVWYSRLSTGFERNSEFIRSKLVGFTNRSASEVNVKINKPLCYLFIIKLI